MRAKLLVFVLGLVVGALGATLLPGKLRPWLPKRVLGAATDGEVAAKGREGELLLLTVLTDEGATLATFSERVAEIDLLVEVGDRVSLGLGGYRPFVENPPIWSVRKLDRGAPPREAEVEVRQGEDPEATDLVPEPETGPPGTTELELEEVPSRPPPPPSDV